MLAGLFVALDVPLTRVMLHLRVVEVERIVTAGPDGFRAGPTDARGGNGLRRSAPMPHLGRDERTDDSDAQRLSHLRWDRTLALASAI